MNKAFISNRDARFEASRTWGNFLGYGYGEAALAEAVAILDQVEPLKASDHIYNGPAAFRHSATRISVNGLSPAGFIVDARDALVDSLTGFVALEVS